MKRKKKKFASHFDNLGSYTGVTEDGDKPVQDVDDL